MDDLNNLVSKKLPITINESALVRIYSLADAELPHWIERLSEIDRCIEQIYQSSSEKKFQEICLLYHLNQDLINSRNRRRSESETIENKMEYEQAKLNSFVNALMVPIENFRTTWPTCLKVVHKLIAANRIYLNKLHPGVFRKHRVCLGRIDCTFETAEVIPLNPEDLETALQGLWSWFINNSSKPLMYRICIFYLALIAIHPFADGNGRTARILISKLIQDSVGADIPFLHLGGVMEGTRRDQNNAFRTAFTEKDLVPWLSYFTNQVRIALSQTSDFLDQVTRIHVDVHRLIMKLPVVHRAMVLPVLELLFKNPMWPQHQLEQFSGLPGLTYSGVLQKLISLDVVERRGGFVIVPQLCALMGGNFQVDS